MHLHSDELPLSDRASANASYLVTVVVIVSECTDFLRRAVASALSQNHSPLQVIVIDARERAIPRSTIERSPFVELADLLSAFADRLEVYQQTNGGMACARNLGLRKARGEFVLFLSGEQSIDADTVDRLLSAIDEGGRTYVRAQCKPAGSAAGQNTSESCPAILFARSKDLRAAGGFDERGGQDTLWDLRVGTASDAAKGGVSGSDQSTVGFIVLSNRNPDQVTRLLNRLSSMFENSPIACHHDFGQSDLNIRRFPASVRFVQDFVATRRADFSLVSATLAALQLMYADEGGPDWFILLSGADYPIKPASQIIGELSDNPYDALIHHELIRGAGWRRPWERECADRYLRFRTSIPHITRRGRLTNRKVYLPFTWCRPFVPFSKSFMCYAGSQWFTARRKCAQYILQAHSPHTRLSRHFSRCHVPDEAYFQCILANVPAFRLSQDCKRYIDWTGDGNSPKPLGMDDMPALRASSAHFARKFDASHDSGVLDALDEILMQPSSNQSTAFPNFTGTVTPAGVD